MKHVMIALVLLVSVSVQAQTLQKAKTWEKHYGAAAFVLDSVYVTTATDAQRYVTVTISYDTTAGTTVAYWCPNNDSTTQVQPLRPISGTFGEYFTFKQWGLKFYRIKGAVPVTVRITP